MNTEVKKALATLFAEPVSARSIEQSADEIATALRELNPSLATTTTLSKAIREGIRKYLKETKNDDRGMDERCDFCGKKRSDVCHILVGEFTSICHDCVMLCHKAFDGHIETQNQAPKSWFRKCKG